ncbi:MAG: S4 domain-containing protein [Aestuariivirga sp.]
MDKWLVYARFVKHRADAQALVEAGNLRVNRVRVSKGSLAIKPGDHLTIAVAGQVRVVKVLGEAERRGPPAAARQLYEEISGQTHEGAAQKQDASPPPVC